MGAHRIFQGWAVRVPNETNVTQQGPLVQGRSWQFLKIMHKYFIYYDFRQHLQHKKKHFTTLPVGAPNACGRPWLYCEVSPNIYTIETISKQKVQLAIIIISCQYFSLILFSEYSCFFCRAVKTGYLQIKFNADSSLQLPLPNLKTVPTPWNTVQLKSQWSSTLYVQLENVHKNTLTDTVIQSTSTNNASQDVNSSFTIVHIFESAQKTLSETPTLGKKTLDYSPQFIWDTQHSQFKTDTALSSKINFAHFFSNFYIQRQTNCIYREAQKMVQIFWDTLYVTVYTTGPNFWMCMADAVSPAAICITRFGKCWQVPMNTKTLQKQLPKQQTVQLTCQYDQSTVPEWTSSTPRKHL